MEDKCMFNCVWDDKFMIALKTLYIFYIKYRFLGSSFYIRLTPLFMIFAQKNIVIQDIQGSYN